MLKAWTKSAKPQCLCGFPTLSYYNALVHPPHDTCCFHGYANAPLCFVERTGKMPFGCAGSICTERNDIRFPAEFSRGALRTVSGGARPFKIAVKSRSHRQKHADSPLKKQNKRAGRRGKKGRSLRCGRCAPAVCCAFEAAPLRLLAARNRGDFPNVALLFKRDRAGLALFLEPVGIQRDGAGRLPGGGQRGGVGVEAVHAVAARAVHHVELAVHLAELVREERVGHFRRHVLLQIRPRLGVRLEVQNLVQRGVRRVRRVAAVHGLLRHDVDRRLAVQHGLRARVDAAVRVVEVELRAAGLGVALVQKVEVEPERVEQRFGRQRRFGGRRSGRLGRRYCRGFRRRGRRRRGGSIPERGAHGGAPGGQAEQQAEQKCGKVFFTLITIPYFLCRSAKPIAALLVAAKAQIVCEKVFFTLPLKQFLIDTSCFEYSTARHLLQARAKKPAGGDGKAPPVMLE